MKDINDICQVDLVAALDSNNKADFIRYSKAFLELVNPEENQCQDMPTGDSDLLEAADTIEPLCKLAETENWFSLSYFNIALDYEVSDIEFTAEILTKENFFQQQYRKEVMNPSRSPSHWKSEQLSTSPIKSPSERLSKSATFKNK